MISMACCEGVRRKAPMNYIFLGIFTGNFRLELVSCPMRNVKQLKGNKLVAVLRHS
jgi:hypothetical protein